jgi:hypothetical protein
VKVNLGRPAAWAMLAALVVGTAALGPYSSGFAAHAQNLGQRNVAGSVVDDASSPVTGATVFLQNQKTKAIRSYTSAKDGRFRFAQVNMAQDYDLWAEKDGKRSTTKTVSSWDSRKDFETELKMK